ncbi:MAG TPA: hypothetical protein DCZ72_01910, partial [Armatimonadetes bacterium]|nr:hypothetical protein [Armatimonadota bacterium]
ASGADRRASEASRRADQARAGAFTAGTVAGYTEVRATVSGVVTERITSPGTLVQPGMLIARIAQVDRVRLQANVAQADATEIRPMQPVEVRSPRDPARHDETMVSSVFPTSDPASRTQIVEAVIDNADGYYRPGDLVRLRLGTGDSSAAPSITVPLRAVTQIVRGGGAVIGETEPAVWVVRADPDAQAAEDTDWTCTMHPEVSEPGPGTCPKCKMALVPRTVAGGDQSGAAFRVPVVLGANDGDRVIVRSGLRAGDRVITSGLDVLREGDRVRIVQIDGHAPGEAPPT